MFNYINTWAEAKLAYLRVKETVRSSEAAKQHLSLLDAFVGSFNAMATSNVRSLQKLGDEILRAKYATTFSEWIYEHPEEIKVAISTIPLILVHVLLVSLMGSSCCILSRHHTNEIHFLI